ncbi:SGT1 protein-domain-containing protein [Cyathus striatus]|nr:SGT1 protein-domain-containing protein [Cyathus striatus]
MDATSVHDIFNRPPAIAEDTLQYTIYPPGDLSDKTSATTFAACIQAYVDSLLPGFIWHRDAFEIKIVANPDGEGWILEGRIRVGDCVDDEWITVWLLKEISSKWDVVVSVFDSDGEFLLIEAAEALPAWVTPSNSENRVWIYNSRLHLIPLTHISPPSRKRWRRKLPGAAESDDEGTDDLERDWISSIDAVKLVRDLTVDTTASPAVEKLVWSRISGYPRAANEHTHTTNAYIPSDIAKALAANPFLVQKAVETFYTRDAIQLRAAHRMSRFPPNTCVLQLVNMTRTAYAQLVGQKFFPPKVFGQWQEKEGSKEWRWKDVGMKIAVGFEMLYQESKGRPTSANLSADGLKSLSEANKEALRRSADYQKYIQNLTSAGYFRGEVQDSGLWNELENKAASMFIDVRREDGASRQPYASQVDAAISQVSELPNVAAEEDDDSWLNIDAEDFEHMLESTMGTDKHGKSSANGMDVDEPEHNPEDRVANEQAQRLKDLAAKVESFVEGEGDIDGARFDDEEFSDEPFSDGEASDTDSSDDVRQDISSESAKPRTAEMQAAMDRLVPDLDPSDYGKMPPSFHTGSQRVAPATIVTEIVESKANHDAGTPSQMETLAEAKRIRAPILPRDNFDGVDSDDDTDEEEDEDEEDEEERPQVVGEVEIDMQEEEEEFLEFSRQALGISDEHWNEIINDRQSRGAFLPQSAKMRLQSTPVPNAPKVDTQDAGGTKTEGRKPEPGPRPNVNPNLDSFEAVMKAMDEELSRLRPSEGKSTTSDKGKGKAKEGNTGFHEGEDIETAMDAELKAALEREDDVDDELGEGDLNDYNLIKNFLESFKSQAGLSGPVSNLAGRLQPGWTLPRDES